MFISIRNANELFSAFFTCIHKHNFNGKRVLHFTLSEIWNFIWQRQIFPDARCCWLVVLYI